MQVRRKKEMHKKEKKKEKDMRGREGGYPRNPMPIFQTMIQTTKARARPPPAP
jgi:hypothetical protein